MRAIVYTAPRTFQLEDLPTVTAAEGKVVVRPLLSGVCGTDLHIHDGGFFSRYPLTPGHEILGVVESLGDRVAALRVGQLVAVDNASACGHCANCGRGAPLFCTNFRSLGVNAPGGAAEQVLVAADKCFDAQGLLPEHAVFAEPLACVVHGMDVLDLMPGASVAVIGTGPTGLLLTQALLHGGAGHVAVAGPTVFKLELAKSYGAHDTVLADRSNPGRTATALRQLAPEGYDVAIDATGVGEVIQQLTSLVRDGGICLVYGMADAETRVQWSPYDIFRRELTIKGSFAQLNCFERSLRWLKAGLIRTEGMITHRFALDKYGDALEAVRGDPACLKAAISI